MDYKEVVNVVSKYEMYKNVNTVFQANDFDVEEYRENGDALAEILSKNYALPGEKIDNLER